MTDDTFTIRTSTRALYGRFDSRQDAWAAVERIRNSDHSEAVEGAAVVPLLDGTMPNPLHPRWLGEDAPESEAIRQGGNLTQREIHAAVDSFIGAYNDARSERRGYRYVSGYLLTSDPDLGEAVRVLLAPLYREIGRLTEHSTTLNTVAFAIAEALGDVPPGADAVEGNPVELAQRLIAEARQSRAEFLHELRDKAEQYGEALSELADDIEEDLRIGHVVAGATADISRRQGVIS